MAGQTQNGSEAKVEDSSRAPQHDLNGVSELCNQKFCNKIAILHGASVDLLFWDLICLYGCCCLFLIFFLFLICL